MFKKCDISSVISSTEEFSEQECACCQKKKPILDEVYGEDSENMRLAVQKVEEQNQIEVMNLSLDNINILIKMIIKQQYDDLYQRHKDYTNLKAQEKYKNNYQLFIKARDLILRFESDVSKLMNPLDQQINLQQPQTEIDYDSDQEDETDIIKYEQQHVINCFEEVKTAVLSEDLRLVASCYQNKCQLWDYQNSYQVLEYENDDDITALCFQLKNKLIVADKIGYIIIITFSQYKKQEVWEHKLHNQEVYYLVSKDDYQFYSFAKNNRLILFDQKSESIVFQIDVSIMGFSNFDYCPKNQYLIAPNLLGITIWNGQDGQEITTSSKLYSADNVIQICFDSNTNFILLSLQKQKRILVLSYDTENIKFTVKRIFCVYAIVTNVSWLDNGRHFSIFFFDRFQIRSTKCHKLPLRFNNLANSKTTFFNKQHHTGKYLLSIEGQNINLFLKEYVEK
ncbi:hypothetical protein pb186bvf_009744 [Paramecium bursaria]